jgi:hypothetical protein
LELDPSDFLSIRHQAFDIWLKLTKRDNEAVLAVTMIDQTKSNTIHLALDIPVTVIAPAVGMEFLAPDLPHAFEIEFPLTQFKHIFKLLRHSNFLQISCSSEGLEISLESTQISINARSNTVTVSDPCTVVVDGKSFLKFTSCLITSPSSIKACKQIILIFRFL